MATSYSECIGPPPRLGSGGGGGGEGSGSGQGEGGGGLGQGEGGGGGLRTGGGLDGLGRPMNCLLAAGLPAVAKGCELNNYCAPIMWWREVRWGRV